MELNLDTLLNLTSAVSSKLLPILGAAAFVFLIIFLRKLIALLVTANDAVGSLKNTLDSANKQLDALDKPMQTLNELSETVDNVHDASKQVMRGVLTALIDNIGALINMVSGKNEESDQQAAEQEIIRGEEHEPSNQ